MPLIAILVALTVTLITIFGIAFGMVAGRSSLLLLSEQPIEKLECIFNGRSVVSADVIT